MKLRKPGAVLFDWDNTLVDSFGVIHAALNDALDAFDLPKWSYEEVCERVARSMRDSFPAIFGDRWHEASEVFYASYARRHLEHVSPLPGAAGLLEALRDVPVYLGIVSNKNGEYLRREVRHLGWEHYFGRVVGAADAAEDKPASAPVRLALSGSGVAPGGHVWFVGDNAIDVACAEGSGCLPIVVRGAAHTGVDDVLSRVRWRFEGCAELAVVVQRL